MSFDNFGSNQSSLVPACTGVPKGTRQSQYNWAFNWTDSEKVTMKDLVDLEEHRTKNPDAFEARFKSKLFCLMPSASAWDSDDDENLPSHLSNAYRQYVGITRWTQEDVMQLLAWAISDKELQDREHCKRPSVVDIP